MIETRGNDIYRAGIKIGWINGDRIYDNMGKMLGYFSSNAVYDAMGKRVAVIGGDFVYVMGKRMEMERIIENVAALGFSDAVRVAIATFLGV